MKHSKNLLAASIILSLAFVSFPSIAMADQKPYCVKSSNSGASWWVWTVSSLAKACKIANKKVTATGQTVNWTWKSYYSDNSLNKGVLICHRKKGVKKLTKTKVYGNGADIFPNAINVKNTKKYAGCYLKIKQ